MFDLFKQGSRPKDVKSIRSTILQFIKEQLQKAEGGEGENIKGLCLYLTCKTEEKHLYEAAVYADDEERFKEDEIQKIADDYAIALPPDWTFEMHFVDTAPPETITANDVDAALFVSTKKKPKVHKEATAYIRVLNGDTEEETYTLTSSPRKINIGREKRVQTSDGFMRENLIAFTGNDNPSNRSVSRQHAHIVWDNESGSFLLYPDEGGVPPMNKIKVREAEGNIFKLQATEVGHQLREGDQIILGESALLEFTYVNR